MSEFTFGYYEVYRSDLLGMLDLAEELPMFMLPTIVVQGNPFGEDEDGFKDTEIVTSNIEDASMALETEKRIGNASIYGVGGRATISLAFNELEKLPFIKNGLLEPEQQEQVDSIVKNTVTRVQSGISTYTKYDLVDATTEESVTIATIRIVDVSGLPLARELTIEVQDEYVKRSLMIEELPTLDGQDAITVKQRFSPVEDEAMRNMTDFFTENNDTNSVAILFQLFTNELIEVDITEDMNDLLNRYETLGKRQELQTHIDKMKDRAIKIKQSRDFNLTNQDLSLPNFDELQSYIEILNQVRS